MDGFKTKWDLKKYFFDGIDDERLIEIWDNFPKEIDDFCSKYKGKIKGLDAEGFLEYFSDKERIEKKIMKVALYLSYRQSLDTQDQDLIKKNAEFRAMMTEQANKQLFIDEELKLIGSERLLEFSKDLRLSDYKNFFVQEARSIRYMLDPKTEFAINLKDESGVSAFMNLYMELTNSFMFKMEIDGEEKILTDAEVRSLRMSPDRNVREKALRAIREVYSDKKVQITLGNVYQSIVKDWVYEVKLRKYESVMSPRNVREELDDEVIDMLIRQVNASYGLVKRFFAAKAKAFGKDKLDYCDIHAPFGDIEKKYPFDMALEMYLLRIKEFDEEFYLYSLDMFRKGRVDAFPVKGKRGGAFASYSKDFESYVLLNHTDKLDSVSTLFHELGHAVHGHLSQKQKSVVYDSPLSLAETASIFNEMILAEDLLENLEGEERLSYLGKRIENILSTIFWQIQYVCFEKKVHELVISGRGLSYVDLNRMWREEQVKMLGDSVIFDVKADLEIGWSTIPHIHMSPFYCYSYAFGNLLSFALYDMYKKEGKVFVKDYKDILRAGGSVPPYGLLKQYGFDIKKKEFYKEGLRVVEGLIEEFEKSVQNKAIK